MNGVRGAGEGLPQEGEVATGATKVTKKAARRGGFHNADMLPYAGIIRIRSIGHSHSKLQGNLSARFVRAPAICEKDTQKS